MHLLISSNTKCRPSLKNKGLHLGKQSLQKYLRIIVNKQLSAGFQLGASNKRFMQTFEVYTSKEKNDFLSI